MGRLCRHIRSVLEYLQLLQPHNKDLTVGYKNLGQTCYLGACTAHQPKHTRTHRTPTHTPKHTQPASFVLHRSRLSLLRCRCSSDLLLPPSARPDYELLWL